MDGAVERKIEVHIPSQRVERVALSEESPLRLRVFGGEVGDGVPVPRRGPSQDRPPSTRQDPPKSLRLTTTGWYGSLVTGLRS